MYKRNEELQNLFESSDFFDICEILNKLILINKYLYKLYIIYIY